MTTLFLICSVVGGTVLVCQFVMIVIGLGGDHDLSTDGHVDVPHDAGGFDADVADADHSEAADHDNSTWFFKVITFRTVVAAFTFFGLAGMAATASGMGPWQTIAVAVCAGAAAMFGVHWLMLQIERLNADGTVRINEAVGMTGMVYLRIPANNAGAGKVQINLQNRTVELLAFTAAEEIPTGTSVVVLTVVGPDSVAVERTAASHEVTRA